MHQQTPPAIPAKGTDTHMTGPVGREVGVYDPNQKGASRGLAGKKPLKSPRQRVGDFCLIRSTALLHLTKSPNPTGG